MKFEDVEIGMFFYRYDRGLLLFVTEKSEYSIGTYIYDKKREEFATNVYDTRRWKNTIWGREIEMKNKNHFNSMIIKGLFSSGKVIYEV